MITGKLTRREMCWFILTMWIFVVQADPEVSTITSQLNPQVRIINKLTTLNHGVTSGKIMVINNNMFEIPNFHFDGKAPQTFFRVGTGEISEDGTFLYLNESQLPLPRFDGQSVTLTLPDGLTVMDFDWLTVWSTEYHQCLGHVFLHRNDEYPPQTFNFNNIVTSGPVVLINKKTLFIPSFRYGGDHANAHFWVGNGSEPSPDGVAVPDESGSSDGLGSYQGKNLYIKLPSGLSTDNIDYFGVWSQGEGVSLGFVNIKGIEGVPEVPTQKGRTLLDGTRNSVMLLPKCCPVNSVLTVGGCVEILGYGFEPRFKVYEHNETHFSNESLDLGLIEFQPYSSPLNCKTGKYPLDSETEEFALLQNTSLLLKSTTISGIFSTDQFCLENIETNNNTYEMKILICAPEHDIQKAMFITYVTFTFISTLCFATAFFFYFFLFKVASIHRECFTAYVFSMTITFLCLTIIQLANIENSGCEVLGFIFQIFIMASFTLLGILCVDIYIIIKYMDQKKFKLWRKRIYIAVSLGVPLLFLIISLSRNLTPDVPDSFFKPQYMNNNCFFEAEEQRTIIFYIPICLSIITSAIFLILTKLAIIHNDKEEKYNNYWMEDGKIYKFMWRKHLIIFVISFLWSFEALIHMYLMDSSMSVAVDIVEASQGIIVLLLFVLNKDNRNQIVKSLKLKKTKKNANCILEETIMLEQ